MKRLVSFLILILVSCSCSFDNKTGIWKDASEITNIKEKQKNKANLKDVFVENKDDLVLSITNWVKKMRHGGKIVVTSIDALEVAKAFAKQKIDIDTFNKAIHGGFSQGWDIFLNHTTIEELSSVLEKLGLFVTKKRINGINFIIRIRII